MSLYTLLGNARTSDIVALDTGFFCVSLICGQAVCLRTYCWRNLCDGGGGGGGDDDDDDGVRFTEDTGLFCVTVVCVCVCARARARVCIRNVTGQMCSRSSMMFC